MEHKRYQYVLGIDFGTDPCRALVVDASNGREIAVGVAEYPRWKQGLYCQPKFNQYRQHPLDYIESLETAVYKATAGLSGTEHQAIVGITVDTTGSMPAITNEQGQSLALSRQYAGNPDAMFVLWKDHTAVKETEQINELIAKLNLSFNQYPGGTYSSEWIWAKVLHILKKETPLCQDAYSWVEHCDWISGLLAGHIKPEMMLKSRCAAGHKAMWHEDWGLPSKEYLKKLHPQLGEMREHLYQSTYTCAQIASELTEGWAIRLGLTPGIAIGAGAIDAHMRAVGASVAPGVLMGTVGTSTCDIMVSPKESLKNPYIQGISGRVDGSVLPGYIGIEVGRTAFGDIFIWFKSIMSWALLTTSNKNETESTKRQILTRLIQEAAKIKPYAAGLVALDWMNGRRTPNASQNLKGAIANITLGTSAPEIYRALVESTVFGLKRIIEHARGRGLDIKSMNAVGGISKKPPFVIQILSDVTEMPIETIRSESVCALGPAMFAAAVSSIYPVIEEAEKYMMSEVGNEYTLNPKLKPIYDQLYQKYLELGHTAEQLI